MAFQSRRYPSTIGYKTGPIRDVRHGGCTLEGILRIFSGWLLNYEPYSTNVDGVLAEVRSIVVVG